MKKAEFLDKLCQGLRFQTDPDEIRKVVAFYDQAIEDRIEDGMGEEEAVAALGDLNEILRGIREAWEQSAGPGPQGDAPVGQTVRLDYDPHVSGRFEIFGSSPDVELLPSPDGLVHLEYRTGGRWNWQAAGESTVTVRPVPRDAERERIHIDLFGFKFDFNKPDFFSPAGDEGLKLLLPAFFPTAVSVNTASGDVTAKEVRLASLSVKSVSGDANLRHVEAEGRISIASSSGDVELYRVGAAEAGVVTVSGDVRADLLRVPVLTVRTTSGDVELEDTEIGARLSAATVSGDMDLRLAVPCPEADLESVSGDVCLELPGGDGLYTVLARSKSGDVDVDGEALGGPNQVKIRTVSGDIDVSFEG